MKQQIYKQKIPEIQKLFIKNKNLTKTRKKLPLKKYKSNKPKN